ncbi:MAG: hypothetical protein WC162_12005 [Sphaerochaetaceae bacterium]
MKQFITVLLVIFFLIAPLTASEGFSLIFDEEVAIEKESSPAFDISGNLSTGMNTFVDIDNPLKSETNAFADLSFSLNYTHPFLGGNVELFLPALNEETPTYKNIIKEISLSYYLPNGKIQAGYFIHRWGVVDTARVVDVINANDYSSGLNMDQREMKISEPMILTQLYFDKSQLELIYKPIFTPIQIATEGRWNTIPDISGFLTISGATDFLEPNIKTLEYGSFGTRYAISLGSVDTAIMYYRGYYERPGYKYTFTPALIPPFDVTSVETIYTKMNIIGAEANYVTGPFTLAFEGAYYLSEDKDGIDSTLYNSKFCYTGSVSYMIGGTTSYITASYNGTSIFDYDDTNAMDVDATSGPKQDHNIIVGFHIPLFKEKLLVEAGLTYQIPTQGYALLARLDYTLKDDITLSLNGNLFGTFDNNEESMYKNWDSNDLLSITLKYQY